MIVWFALKRNILLQQNGKSSFSFLMIDAKYGDNENEGCFFLHEPGIVLEEVWKALTKPCGYVKL